MPLLRSAVPLLDRLTTSNKLKSTSSTLSQLAPAQEKILLESTSGDFFGFNTTSFAQRGVLGGIRDSLAGIYDNIVKDYVTDVYTDVIEGYTIATIKLMGWFFFGGFLIAKGAILNGLVDDFGGILLKTITHKHLRHHHQCHHCQQYHRAESESCELDRGGDGKESQRRTCGQLHSALDRGGSLRVPDAFYSLDLLVLFLQGLVIHLILSCFYRVLS